MKLLNHSKIITSLFLIALMLSSAIPMMPSDVYAADGDILRYITGFSGSWEVAFDSANNRMYVTNNNSDTVSVINTSTDAIIATISVGDFPMGSGI